MWETVPPHRLRRAAAEPAKIAQVLPVCIGTEADRAQRSTNAIAPRRSRGITMKPVAPKWARAAIVPSWSSPSITSISVVGRWWLAPEPPRRRAPEGVQDREEPQGKYMRKPTLAGAQNGPYLPNMLHACCEESLIIGPLQQLQQIEQANKKM
jgi:hypothetical protein